MKLNNDITKRVTRQYAHRKDRELYSAWRAGYNFLHVVTDRTNPMRQAFVPSDHKWAHLDRPEYRVETYDLREVTHEEINATRKTNEETS